MCGRYRRNSDKQRLAEAFRVAGGLDSLDLEPDDDVRPTTVQPIIRLHRDTGERTLVAARWGFVPSWHSPGQRLPANLFNARAETVGSTPTWRRAFAQHRCLVPADSFFEWRKPAVGSARPRRAGADPKFRFAMRNHAPFAFAGLWSAWRDPANDQWLQSFTIITTDPNQLLQSVHNRMPVILHPRDYDRWLARGPEHQSPVDLLRPFEPELMEMTPASTEPSAELHGDSSPTQLSLDSTPCQNPGQQDPDRQDCGRQELAPQDPGAEPNSR